MRRKELRSYQFPLDGHADPRGKTALRGEQLIGGASGLKAEVNIPPAVPGTTGGGFGDPGATLQALEDLWP